jgi:hypothetical protein
MLMKYDIHLCGLDSYWLASENVRRAILLAEIQLPLH